MEFGHSLVIIAVLTLSLLRYKTGSLCLACTKHGNKIMSFIIGAAIMLIFLHLLSVVYFEIGSLHPFLILLLPIGFCTFLFIEQHVQHHKRKDIQTEEARTVHLVLSAISRILVGFALIQNTQSSLVDGILLIFVFVLYDLIDTITLHSLHHRKEVVSMKHKLRRVLFSLAPVYGYVIGLLINIPRVIHFGIVAFLTGIILHAIFREIIPEEKRILPLYFSIGVLFFVGLFFLDAFLVS